MTNHPAPRYSVALFDLDGTLCDPGTGIADAVRHGLAQIGLHEDDVVVEKTVTLRDALAAMGWAPHETVMIGDREHDVHAARENQLDSIGVLYGYGSRDELVRAGATHLAERPESVETLVLGGL